MDSTYVFLKTFELPLSLLTRIRKRMVSMVADKIKKIKEKKVI
jgi:hypothetical protein